MEPSCKDCRAPKIVAKTHTWRDGCIVEKASGNANLCLYEASFHNALFERASAELGVSLDNIIVSAGRRASTKVIRDLLSEHPLLGKAVFKAPLYHLTQRALVAFGKALGVGDLEIVEHRKGKHGTIHMTNPYHLAHVTAIILGAMDVMYESPVAIDVQEKEGGYSFQLISGKSNHTVKEEAFARLATTDLRPSRQGNDLQLPACERCGAPLDLGILYRFDLERGVITEQLNQERVVLLGINSLNSILRELERELGYDINDLFIRVEEESLKRKLAVTLLGEDLRDTKGLRSYLALRGLGMLTGMEKDGDQTSFRVENVFIGPMVAGRLIALCEYQHRRRCDYQYSLQDNTLELTAVPT